MDSAFAAIDAGLGLTELGLGLRDLLLLVALCSIRVYAAMFVLPATQEPLLSGVVRNGTVLMIAATIAFGQPAGWVDSLTVVQLLLLVVKEAFIGMLLGLAAGTVFWIAEGVGMLIDNYAGYNNIQQTNPVSGQASTPVGNLLMQLAVVGFYALGGMTVFIGLLADSYSWWPLQGAGPDWARLGERFLPTELARLSETTLRIAGPVLVTLMLIDLGIGLIAKAADKLEPASLAQPIKGATAMLMLVLLVSVFFDQVRDELSMQRTVQRVKLLLVTPAR